MGSATATGNQRYHELEVYDSNSIYHIVEYRENNKGYNLYVLM